MNSSPLFHLQLLGTPSVRAKATDSGPGVQVQRRRVALLALLALADERGVTREKILGYLWPESDTEHARSRLNVAVYALRKALGEEAIISEGEGLRLNRNVIESDVAAFENEVEQGGLALAVESYSGPLLDGFFIADAPEFERWVERERDRLSRLYCGALEKLAAQSERAGNLDLAAQWWKSRAAQDPYDSRVALKVMQALDASGNTAAALHHAVMHERRLKEDFGVEPAAELKNAAEKLRARRSTIEGIGSARNNLSVNARVGPRADLPAHPITSERGDLPAMEVGPATRIDSYASAHVTISWHNRRYALLAGIVIVTGVAGLGISTQRSEGAQRSSKQFGVSVPTASRIGSHAALARHDAEDFYYQGRYLTTANQNPAGFAGALALYSKAVERDPTFAKAYAGMADAYNYMENPREARASALKALSLDSTSAEALNALAYVYGFYEHRWLAADSAAERATRLSPQFTLAYLRRANINAALGRPDVAFASLEKARALEPESWTVLYNRGFVASALGVTDEAIKYLEAALALTPERKEVRAQLAWQYWGAGRKDEANALLRNSGDPTDAAILSGDKGQLRGLIRRFETDSTTLLACQAAVVYLKLGNKDAAFRQLKRAVNQNRFLPLIVRSPPFVSLKDDPRYGELKSELGIR